MSYFLVGALSIDDRRRHEFELLDHYATEMERRGVRRSELGDVRERYRRQHLHGLFWGFLPDAYQSADRCIVMADEYAAALLDHDTLGALGL